MTDRFAVALGATCAILAAYPAVAGNHGDGAGVRRQILPPVSGTIAVPQGGFGRGGAIGARAGQAQGGGRRRPPAGAVSGYAGSRFSAGQAQGYAQIQRSRYGYAYSAPSRGFGWTSGGTGLVGLIGDGGNPFAGAGTRWGTADSATTGGGFYRYGGDSVRVAYGEPDLWTNASYGAPPRLATYQSGAPYSMGYYSSGSSAGPNGSPGGLGVYSSGAYGPGPRVVIINRYARRGTYRQGCSCGPHIIHVDQRHRHVARW